jgi:hypothetical protein
MANRKFTYRYNIKLGTDYGQNICYSLLLNFAWKGNLLFNILGLDAMNIVIKL